MSMNLAKDKINNKKIDVQSHDIFLSIASDNFKYALCEKLKRPKADIATIRIDNHEKLCRIMQKETHEKIDNICFRIKRLEYILITSAGGIIVGLTSLVIMLLNK
jgi:hypothetical protein